MSDAEAAGPAASHPRMLASRALSPVGLGFLALVPVALALLTQALQVGFGISIASALPVADSNLWSGCASALAHLSTPENLDWCLKRPATMFLEAPFFLASPWSTAAAILLQTLVLSAIFWWFLCTLRSTMPLRPLAMWAVVLVGIWPVFLYGIQFGTETPALALSFVSAVGVLRALHSERVGWAFLAGACALLAFQMRPGNPVLTLFIPVGAVVLAWRRKERLGAARRWLTSIGIVGGFWLVWWLPDQVMRWAGWREAGHSSNFWSVLYSAASPAADTWEAAYARYAQQVGCSTDWNPDPCPGLETAQFGETLREGALQFIRDSPLAIPRQALTNLRDLLDTGFINNLLVNPYPPIWRASRIPDAASGWNVLGLLLATTLWLMSAAMVVALVVAVIRVRPGAELPKRLRGLAPRPLRMVRASVWLGVATVLGIIGFFALVGHDEQQRHMVQSIPFVLIALAGLFTIFWGPESPAASPPAVGTAPRRWPKAVLGAVAGVLVLGAVIEGHTTGQSLMLVRSCSNPGLVPQAYQVVGQARWDGGALLEGPSDWRVLDGLSTRSLPAHGWPAQQLGTLPPGVVLTVRSTATGDHLPVFLADRLAAGHPVEGTVWCTQVPSGYEAIIVHDLEPYVTTQGDTL